MYSLVKYLDIIPSIFWVYVFCSLILSSLLTLFSYEKFFLALSLVPLFAMPLFELRISEWDEGLDNLKVFDAEVASTFELVY